MGGPLFMGILTLLFIGVVIVSVLQFVPSFEDKKTLLSSITKELGILALIFGLFSQFLGLYDMFNVLEQIGSISPAMLMGGLKVSAISTMYGFFIAVVAYIVSVIAKIQTVKEA